MENIALLLLKANLAIILFTLFYWLLLRKVTFYLINRVYLLFAIVFSLLFPFIEISFFTPTQLAVIPDIIPGVLAQPQAIADDTWYYIWNTLWITGFIACAIRLFFQFYSLYILHRRSVPAQDAKYIRVVTDRISPFSFGPYIYINPQLHSHEQLNMVLLHEQIHVKHKHTLDILLAELLLLINWFNPAAWLLRKAVKENLEYVTDNMVLKNGVVPKEYQYHLLSTTCITPAFTVQNSFTIADLKKRIVQMNTEKTSSSKLLSYSLIPVLSACLLLLNKPVQDFAEEVLGISPDAVVTVPKENTTIENNPGTTISHNTGNKKQPVEKKKKTLQAAGSLGNKEMADIHAAASSALSVTIKNTEKPVPFQTAEIIVTGYASPKKPAVVKQVQGIEIPATTTASEQTPPVNTDVKIVQGYRMPAKN
jgi:beta-lactamase regulating signal transducer with metallopeptidase domain